MAGLTIKRGLTKKGKDFNTIYSELRQMLKEAGNEAYVEVREVKDYYRIPANKISEFKKRLSEWHLAVVTGPHEGKGKGPDVIVYSSPSPEKVEEKTEKDQGR